MGGDMNNIDYDGDVEMIDDSVPNEKLSIQLADEPLMQAEFVDF